MEMMRGIIPETPDRVRAGCFSTNDDKTPNGLVGRRRSSRRSTILSTLASESSSSTAMTIRRIKETPEEGGPGGRSSPSSSTGGGGRSFSCSILGGRRVDGRIGESPDFESRKNRSSISDRAAILGIIPKDSLDLDKSSSLWKRTTHRRGSEIKKYFPSKGRLGETTLGSEETFVNYVGATQDAASTPTKTRTKNHDDDDDDVSTWLREGVRKEASTPTIEIKKKCPPSRADRHAVTTPTRRRQSRNTTTLTEETSSSSPRLLSIREEIQGEKNDSKIPSGRKQIESSSSTVTSSVDEGQKNAIHEILVGVLACVDVCSGREDQSACIIDELIQLGAKISKTLHRKVTHLVFKEGSIAKYNKAKKLGIPIVKAGWVNACREAMSKVPEELHPTISKEKYDSPMAAEILKRRRVKRVLDTEQKFQKYLARTKRLREEREKKRISSPPFIPVPLDFYNSPIERRQKEKSLLDQILEQGEDFPNLMKTPDPKRVSLDGSPGRRSLSESSIPSSSSPSGLSDDIDTPLALRVARKFYAEKRRSSLGASPLCQSITTSSSQILTKKNSTVSSSVSTTLETVNEATTIIKSNVKRNREEEEEEEEISSGTTNNTNEKSLSKEETETDVNVLIQPLTEVEINNSEKPIKRKERRVNPKRRTLFSQLPGQLMNITPNDTPLETITSNLLIKKDNIVIFNNKKKKDTASIRKKTPVKELKKKTVNPSKSKKKNDRYEEESSSNTINNNNNRRRSSVDFQSNVNDKENHKKRNLDRRRLTYEYKKEIVCTSCSDEDLNLARQIVEYYGGSANFKLGGKSVTERTTHVICGGGRTLNVLRGILRGCWILGKEWLYACIENRAMIDEEPYEKVDLSIAVQNCRIERLSFGLRFYKSNLFRDCGVIYLSRKCSIPNNDLGELIRLGGGRVGNSAKRADIVIGENICDKWILDSVQHNFVMPLDEYTIQ